MKAHITTITDLFLSLTSQAPIQITWWIEEMFVSQSHLTGRLPIRNTPSGGAQTRTSDNTYLSFRFQIVAPDGQQHSPHSQVNMIRVGNLHRDAHGGRVSDK